MRYAGPLLSLLLGLTSCQPLPPPEPATLIRGEGFQPDPTDQAILLVYDVFALGHDMSGNATRMAEAVADMEYLAVDFSRMRWNDAPGYTAPQMILARRELRTVLGIAPNAPAQPVITAFLNAHDALKNGQQDAALRALSGPFFTQPATAILARLTDMPRMPQVTGGAHAAWTARFRPPMGFDCRFDC